MPNDRLEDALNAMRAEKAEPAEMQAAQARVWERLLHAESPLCTEFRGELTAYLAGELAASRRLLFEDHLSRCPGCRRLYNESRGEHKVVAMPAALAPRNPRPAWMKFAIAAGVAAVMLYVGRGPLDRALAPSGPRATVESASGPLFHLASGPIAPGAKLGEGEFVRTGMGARAVLRLADGSRLEMNERTELAVSAAWSGQTVRLERGDVILQAAKQRRGHLRVQTRDSEALVKGTIFAVSSGTAGSLVSVIEGSVEVNQPGANKVLKPGEQAGTTAAMTSVPVRDAVAWSADAPQYFTLLAEFMQIERQLSATLNESLRTQSRLVGLMPANPMMFAAIPNVGRAIDELEHLIEVRARDSATLREWWNSPSGEELRKVLDRVQTITPLLGEEIAFFVTRAPGQPGSDPMMVAEVKSGREDELRQALAGLFAETGGTGAYSIANGRVLVGDNAAALQTALGGGASTEFAAAIAQRYQRGAGWLLAINAANQDAKPGSEPDALGLTSIKHLFFERRAPAGRAENEATVSFAGARRGIASWLAAPAAAGSAEYASPNAIFVASASTRNPQQAFDELISALGRVNSNIPDELRKFEEKTGISISRDLAAAFGTDFTIAIERPTVPIPGWVGAFEVPQPSLLDVSLRRLVDAFNNELPADRAQYRMTLTQEQHGGRTWNVVRSGASTQTVSWTYDRGYMIVSTDRALAAQAITNRAAGVMLTRSARFVEQLPATNSLHHSGFFWLNPEGTLRDAAQLVTDPTLKSLIESSEPVLVTIDGETERIRAVSRTGLMNLVMGMTLTSSKTAHATSH